LSEVIVVLVILAIIAFLLYARNRRVFGPKSSSAIGLTYRLAKVQYMSGSQFEMFVADVMRGLGYRAKVLGGSGDQGVDVIAAAGNERLAIQCKNYKKPVGNKPVQEVYAGARHHRCTAAWVVAPRGYRGIYQLHSSFSWRVKLCR
jgi:HJR/Mrr/RecB family endonuclease